MAIEVLPPELSPGRDAWRVHTTEAGYLTVREAVYEGTFSSPKTEAGVRCIPLAATAVQPVEDWKGHARRTDPEALVFSTWSGKPISPNNVLRR